MRRVVGATAWIGAMLGMASAAVATAIPVDRVVAYVNEYAITRGDIEMAITPQARYIRAQFRDDALTEKLAELYRQALDYLIETRLVLEAYEAQEGRIPEWAVDQQMDEIVRTEFKGDRNALVRTLAQDRMTPAQWREDVKRSMIVSSMRSSVVGRKIVVAPGDLRDYYEANRDMFRSAEHVRLSMIVLRPDEKTLADQIRKKLLDGEDFADLARQVSRGAKKNEGGDWGWLDLNDLRPELADRIRSLALGGVADPVMTEDGIYIVKLIERRRGEPVSFETVQKDIEQKLRMQEAERLHREWIERLKDKAYVWVSDDY